MQIKGREDRTEILRFLLSFEKEAMLDSMKTHNERLSALDTPQKSVDTMPKEQKAEVKIEGPSAADVEMSNEQENKVDEEETKTETSAQD